MPLLDIQNLTVEFHSAAAAARVVDGVSLAVDSGESVCVVGESGCGKSVTALSIARLLPTPPARYVSGEIRLEGNDVLRMSNPELLRIRGRVVSYVFQEPGAALNPVLRVGRQIRETLKLHRPDLRPSRSRRKEALTESSNAGPGVPYETRSSHKKAYDTEILRLLKLVGIPAPELRCRDYPFRMSGGMQQRVMLAMALASRPKLLVADEPTTALDVTIQAQILDLLRDLKRRLNMAMLLITHNLGIVRDIADRVAVMYAGQIVESAPARELLARPLHPYTRGLIASVPRLGATIENGSGDATARVDVRPAGRRLLAIPGSVPTAGAFPPGCRFAPRCALAQPECSQRMPELLEAGPERRVRCPFWRGTGQ